MISTKLLLDAGLAKTDNPLLSELLFFVQQYNALSTGRNTNVDTLSASLAGVVYRAGAYLTSKPPRPKDKNRQRWDALAALQQEATDEAARLGVKLVRGPFDFRQTTSLSKDANIWLEVLDPLHRHGYDLSEKFEKWLADPESIREKISFWKFIGTVPEPEVEYLQGLTYMVNFSSNGRLVDDAGVPIHTQEYKSVFSGEGWGIFVVSPAGDWYVKNHEAGKFHHSSFLGGGAVRAAGEIVVDNGTIRGLTAKTGHYWTTPELMLNLLKGTPQIPRDAVVRPQILDEQASYYRCGDLVHPTDDSDVLSQQEINAALPSWAKKPHTRATKAHTADSGSSNISDRSEQGHRNSARQGYKN